MSKTEIIEALKILNDIAKSNQMAGGLQDQVTKLVYEKMIELLKMFQYADKQDKQIIHKLNNKRQAAILASTLLGTVR